LDILSVGGFQQLPGALGECLACALQAGLDRFETLNVAVDEAGSIQGDHATMHMQDPILEFRISRHRDRTAAPQSLQKSSFGGGRLARGKIFDEVEKVK
jgi:hypothetical protein